MFRLWPRSLLTCERSTTAFLDKQCVLYFLGELQESFSIWLILLGWFPTTFSLKSFTMCFCLRIPRGLQACASHVESFVSAFRKCFEALDGRVRPSNSWSQSFWKSDLSQHEASEHIKARRSPFWRVGGTRALAHSIYIILYNSLEWLCDMLLASLPPVCVSASLSAPASINKRTTCGWLPLAARCRSECLDAEAMLLPLPCLDKSWQTVQSV